MELPSHPHPRPATNALTHSVALPWYWGRHSNAPPAPEPLHLQSQRSLWINCQKERQGWGGPGPLCTAGVRPRVRLWHGVPSPEPPRKQS